MKNLSLLKTCVVFVFCAATAIASPAQTLTTLHNFDGQTELTLTAGWCKPPTGTSTGRPVAAGRDGRWHGLQNHPKRHADHALQLLFATKLH